GRIALATETTDWPETERPRRVGVSSFGISGTNAHLILEQADTVEAPVPDEPELPVVPLLLSGRTAGARAAQALALADACADRDIPLGALANALSRGRSGFEHRAVVLATGRDTARRGFERIAAGGSGPDVLLGEVAPGATAVVFSGQGAQRAGMGRELYAAFPVFAEAFDAVCAQLDQYLERPLRDVLFEDSDAVHRTGFTQPALFAFELAQFRLLESWGLAPEILLGHSVGEITAAHVAGVFDLAAAARLVTARAALMQELPSGGAMVAVSA
ncbi:acyltransferase domain-containing protein, partial [Sciscionella sediminilitoris]|uniref:acyltransferase domain-containing protein n=1 Tax=Sciscionella sediminilitoris TaxID=1445613 RepID=UPI000561BDC7